MKKANRKQFPKTPAVQGLTHIVAVGARALGSDVDAHDSLNRLD